MTSIDTSIRSRDFERDGYSEAEITAMKRDESASSVMNRVRRDAGLTGQPVPIRGDDRSKAELKKAWSAHDGPHAGAGLVKHVAVDMAEGTALELLAPALFAYEAGKAYLDAKERGQELKSTAERAAMHIALVNALDVPQGYRNVEQGRWRDVGTGFSSAAFKMAERLETKAHAEAAILQLHADRGMNAARDLIGAGLIKDDFDPAGLERALAMAPDVKAKVAVDPAYRAGFEALVWAKQHDAAAYGDTLRRLDARDLRYTQASISFRG